MRYKSISSTQNPEIKRVLQLQEKSRTRRKEGLFVIEGQRELLLAQKGGYEIRQIFFCLELIPQHQLENLLEAFPSDLALTQLSEEVYRKLAYRGGSEGILALAVAKETSLDLLELSSKNPLILVAEAPEKPGNIGALLRTADAAKVDAVLIANPKTDLYNPNIIRSSVGGVFTNTVATGSTSEIITFLQNRSIGIYAAALQASLPYTEVDLTRACAIVVGTEDQGLSKEWREASTQNIIIPMRGAIDSMNVSVAAGILLFEACRQRKFT